MTGASEASPLRVPLISGKPFAAFTPDEFHAHVTAMYALPQRGRSGAKSPALVEGVSVIRTKSGALSVRRAKAKRAFAWVTREEIRTLATGLNLQLNETWNAFAAKEWLIVTDRMEAERRYAELKGIPF